MNNKSDAHILAERKIAVSKAENELGEPVELIDSFIETAPDDANPLWYLAKSIEFLSKADIAYFVKGWKDARGCKIEHECAKQYNVKIIEE